MTELKKFMKFRENIHHFKKDDPGKEKIDQILKDAHALVPHKNNMWGYHIDVYGPEHAEEKERVALQTVTGYDKRAFAPGGADEDDYEKLSNIYRKWKEGRETLRKDNSRENQIKSAKYKGYGFNDQVNAPYLLVYYQKPGYPTEKQVSKGYKKLLIGYQDNEQWMIGASMHGYGVTLLAAEQKLHASFCKCYFHSFKNFTNILAPLNHGFHNIAFLLGIGYRDEELHYYKNKNVPDFEEIVTWK
tara:strand:+ start:899 stop:1633 length:735 start_codon:yes stop_codon:yes gene_type:complete